MKDKGYTLIELLGVIIILAVLITLIFPSIINYIKSSNDTKDDLTIDLIMNAAQLFVEDNSNDFINTSGKQYCLKLNTLIENNYLKGDLEYEGESLLGVKDLQLTYDNEFIFELVNSDECKTNELYIESLNINSPDLYNNTLTPVVYDGNNWVIANLYSEWYSYKDQKWANAVILNSNVNKKVGDVVTVDGTNPDVLAMLVWIPRYEYKIEGTYGKGGTSKTSPGEIEVNFINKNIKEASNTYRIHPAFNFGGENISGIWVGKFELSHTTKTTSSLGCKTDTCSESNGLRILPNVQSLRNNTVSSFFYAIRSMNKEENVFGLNSGITDSHMMKNSEWGAVAYLSQSRYGKYGNNTYDGADKEVYINNSSGFYTGRSGGSYGGNTPIDVTYSDQVGVTTQYNNTGYYTYDGYLLEYNTNTKTERRDLNKVASTTGNIYGIYDMSGGAFEYVMGVFADSSGEKYSGTSGFENSWPDEKYYNIYKASSGISISSTTACNGIICYGHALSEIDNWYNDTYVFLDSSNPWFIRGGYSTNNNNSLDKVGIFYYYKFHGNSNGSGSARVVLGSAT